MSVDGCVDVGGRRVRVCVRGGAWETGEAAPPPRSTLTVVNKNPLTLHPPIRDVARLQDEWFADTDAVKAVVGLTGPDPTADTASPTIRCGICFDDVPRASTLAARCGHPYCTECWGGYVQAAISDGARSSLDLRCPLPKCRAAVPRSVVLAVASPADAARYDTFAVRSYVEDNRRASWCTGAGCEAAAEATVDVGGDALDVACTQCGKDFCFTCGEDAHRPVDCATVKKWMVKNSAESENLNWILAHTKACPKCKRPIEKNQGCMHMTCSQCRHNFCWLCEAPWSDHGERTGGFYACNRYETQRKAGAYDDVAAQRERARTALERYTHYYQRWAEHDRARTRAAAQAVAAAGAKLDALADATATPPSQLRFVLDAWAQVVQCRRILKWTYAYGYYRFAEVGGGGGARGRQRQRQRRRAAPAATPLPRGSRRPARPARLFRVCAGAGGDVPGDAARRGGEEAGRAAE